MFKKWLTTTILLLITAPVIRSYIHACYVYGLKDSQGRETCSRCRQGHYAANHNLECHTCDHICMDCSISANNCTDCWPGFLLSGHTCEKCIDNCMICKTKTSCTVCNSSYYLKSESVCAPCMPGCEHCTASKTCNRCKPGYTLVKNHGIISCVNGGMGWIAWSIAFGSCGVFTLFMLIGWLRARQQRQVDERVKLIADLAAAANVNPNRMANNDTMNVSVAPPDGMILREMEDFSISRIEHRLEEHTLDDYNIRDSLEIDNDHIQEPTL